MSRDWQIINGTVRGHPAQVRQELIDATRSGELYDVDPRGWRFPNGQVQFPVRLLRPLPAPPWWRRRWPLAVALGLVGAGLVVGALYALFRAVLALMPLLIVGLLVTGIALLTRRGGAK